MDNRETRVDSLQNPRVKHVVRLRERRERDKTGKFLIEGYRELLRAIDANCSIDTLFVCREMFLGSNEEALIRRCVSSGAELIACSEKVFAKLSYRDRPDGLLAIAPQMHRTLDDLALPQEHAPLILAAESIEKPGNLGTILRSCDAAGVDGVIVCDRTTDIHNPNVVRASVGTLFTVPVIEAEGASTLHWLKKNGIALLAATPYADAVYTDVDMRRPLALAVGSEQLGLSPAWLNSADIKVRIPMKGVADSLNAAQAATLLLYEAVRQRNHGS